MTLRTVEIIAPVSDGRGGVVAAPVYERQMSVPWCTAHDAPYKGHPDLDAPMCLYAAWAVVDKPSLVGSCIIKDGAVWKVVTE